MALIRCHECGKEISDEAATCPGCGAKPKKTSLLKIIFLAFFGVVIYQTVSHMDSSESAAASKQTSQDERNERAREDAAFELGKAVRKAVRDPDSVVFEAANTNADGTIICAVFRAKNGFGGYSKESVLYVNGQQLDATKDVKKYCSSATYDMKIFAQN